MNTMKVKVYKKTLKEDSKNFEWRNKNKHQIYMNMEL